MQHILIALIMLYRRCLSPFLPPMCRFYPTCSEYSLQAIRKYGALKGGWLTIRRLVRCHPLCDGGHDPVE